MTITNQQVRDALRGSQEKWRNIAKGEGRDGGVDNCPLCALFFDADCIGCPVAEYSKRKGCIATPYVPWSDLCDDSMHYADTPAKKAAAQAELDFLLMLEKYYFGE